MIMDVGLLFDITVFGYLKHVIANASVYFTCRNVTHFFVLHELSYDAKLKCVKLS